MIQMITDQITVLPRTDSVNTVQKYLFLTTSKCNFVPLPRKANFKHKIKGYSFLSYCLL